MVDVILLERVEKLGQMGQIVKVKPGYARNFLLPQKKAMRATKENMAYFETQRVQLEAMNLQRKSEAEQVAEKLEGLTVVVIRQAGESGQLYGSVAARDIAEAVTAAGAVAVSYDEADAGAAVDAVVAGFHREFDWERMRIASTAVRAGARFLATNDDATYPTESGLVPGAGSIVAGIATAAGVAPTIAGKPHEPMVRLLLGRCGGEGIVVGDRPDTDGALARACGWRFGLVLSGVTAAADLPVDPAPDLVAPDLGELVGQLLQ